jgi:hypothetical protein
MRHIEADGHAWKKASSRGSELFLRSLYPYEPAYGLAIPGLYVSVSDINSLLFQYYITRTFLPLPLTFLGVEVPFSSSHELGYHIT